MLLCTIILLCLLKVFFFSYSVDPKRHFGTILNITRSRFTTNDNDSDCCFCRPNRFSVNCPNNPKTARWFNDRNESLKRFNSTVGIINSYVNVYYNVQRNNYRFGAVKFVNGTIRANRTKTSYYARGSRCDDVIIIYRRDRKESKPKPVLYARRRSPVCG